MDLHDFLKKLEGLGQLRRITAEVDPELEITEIAQRQMALGGPALLFEKVKGSDFPVAMNLNATRERLRLGLGIDPGELGNRAAALLADLMPPRPAKLWQHRHTIQRGLRMRLKHMRSSPVQDEVDVPGDLTRLPVLKCWPKDGGRFITLPLVATANPVTGRTNLGMYRMQVFGPGEAGMHWQIGRGAEAHAFATRNGRLPCAVAIGGDPALIFSAIMPLPEDMEELPFAGFLRGAPQPMVRASTQPLWVPANAEFVLEGFVDLKDLRLEGPFGDHLGHYSHAAPYPAFKMTALTRRKNAIYPATVVGKPPQEDRIWGEAVNEFSQAPLKLLFPELSGFWTYYEAGFHNLLVVSTRQRHRKEGIKTALGLLGQGQLSLCKVVVLVDEGVDPRDFRAVLREAAKNFDPREDVVLIPGAPLDTLDFTSFVMNLGSKLILDCTSTEGISPVPLGSRKSKPPALRRPFNPDKLKRVLGSSFRSWASLEDTLLAVRVELKAGQASGAALLRKILDHVPLGTHKWVALASPDVDIFDPVELIWGIFTRFDAARDIQFTRSSLRQAWPLHEGVLGIDATFKKGYPEVVKMSRSIIRKVDRRWKEYGF